MVDLEPATSQPAASRVPARYVGFATRPASFGTPVRAETTLERYLVLLWEREIRLGPIGIDDDFFALGGDSLNAVAIFAAIEKDYGANFYPSIIVERPTVRDLARHIKEKLDADNVAEPTLVTFRAAGGRPPLYIVHGAGGEVVFAQPLVEALGDDQPVYGFRNTFNKPDRRTTIGDFAERYLAHIPDDGRPVGLIGYSGGALIAFEMAHRLQATGRRIASLVLIDIHAPGHLQRRRGGPLQRVVRAARRRLGPIRRRLFPPRDGTMAREDANAGDIRQTMAWAVDRYRPDVFDGKIDLILRHRKDGNPKRGTMGWRAHSTQRVAVHSVEGTHWSIMMPPRVAAIAEIVRRAQAAAD